MACIDPSVAQRFQSALQDPQARVVCVGSKSRWARPLVRALWSTAVYGAIFMGVFTTGVKVAEVSGLGGELNARMHPMPVQQQHPQQVQWLEMPTSPFLEVARTPEGSYSIARLVGAYKAAGMTEAQGKQVAKRLRDLSPVLMGARDDRLAQELRQQAFNAAAKLQRDYPVFHRRLVEQMKKQVVHMSYRHQQWDHPENWPEVRNAVWANEGALPSGVVEQDILDGMDFAQAKEAAEQAVLETGVRALRVHPSNWSPASLYDLAQGLRDAEVDMEEATGMEGQVVGLGGRVVLMMGAPPAEDQAAGITKLAEDGSIFVNAQWNNLSHEWLHVLDFTAAQHVMSAPALDGLSQQLQPLRMTEHRDVFNAWKQALADIDDTSPAWQQERQKRVQSEMVAREALAAHRTVEQGAIVSPDYNPGYWLSPSEGMAYAFQAYVADSQPLVLKGRQPTTEAFRMPSQQEVKRQAPVWKRLFASIDPLELTRPMPPLPSPEVSPRSAPARR